MNEQFSPLETFRRAYKGWWWVIVMMVLGAGAGEIWFRVHPPIYEAEAAISVSIDFTRTGMLTDVEEDYAIGIVGDVISSPRVVARVVEQAQENGMTLDVSAFREMMFTERQNNVWRMRVRHPQAEAAARLANLWAESAYAALQESAQHALIASGLQRYLDSLESCLEQSVVSGPAQAYCRPDKLGELLVTLKKTGQEANRENLASQGVMPGTTFILAEKAEVPRAPVLYGRGLAVLAGALTGMIVGLGMLTFDLSGWPLRRQKIV